MKIRKIAAVLAGAIMLTSTVAIAAAANYSAPFVSNGNADVAIVYGSTAAPSDFAAVLDITSNLATKLAAQTAVSSGSSISATGGVAEDEVTLGGGLSGDVNGTLTEADVPALLDGSMSWDDGDGSEEYNIHEELIINAGNTDMEVITSLDDNDLTGVALTQDDSAIQYRLVFEEAFNSSRIGDDDADTLYLDILGKTYEVEGIENDSITLVTSTEKALMAGQSYVFNDVTITVDNVFEGSVQVNGEIISDGATKKIGGLRVEVSDIGYHSNSPETSVAILKIGEDISKTYNDGDEYVGEDEDNPNWVWDINFNIASTGMTTADDYIGVVSDQSITEAEDPIVYVGGSYLLPENFAEVKLVGTTAVSYEDIKVSFDDSMDLFNSSDSDDDGVTQNAPVVIIEAENDDSITTTTGSHETNTVYLRWATNTTGTEANVSNGSIEVFYKDVDADIEGVKPRYAGKVNSIVNTSASISNTAIASIEVQDTTIGVSIAVTAGAPVLNLSNGANIILIDLGGDALDWDSGSLEWLGGTTETDSKENAESGDVSVRGTNVGTENNDVMDYYGTIVRTPEANADSDKVVISVPSEQVYGEVAVLGHGGSVSGSSSGSATALGSVSVADNEVSTVSGKNLIVVGGSCVNSVAAKLLGGASCGESFTTASGIKAGEALIKTFASPYSASKVATLVAGYNAADTTNAAKYLTTQTVEIAAGKGVKVTSATQAVALTSTA